MQPFNLPKLEVRKGGFTPALSFKTTGNIQSLRSQLLQPNPFIASVSFSASVISNPVAFSDARVSN